MNRSQRIKNLKDRYQSGATGTISAIRSLVESFGMTEAQAKKTVSGWDGIRGSNFTKAINRKF